MNCSCGAFTAVARSGVICAVDATKSSTNVPKKSKITAWIVIAGIGGREAQTIPRAWQPAVAWFRLVRIWRAGPDYTAEQAPRPVIDFIRLSSFYAATRFR